MPEHEITVIGAGLAGSLLALQLAQRGVRVRVFERRPDPRNVGYLGGRSINMALAERGLHALRGAGLEREVLDHAVMMRGRMVHDASGSERFFRYGRDDSEVLWSIHRGRLNTCLIQAAEASGAAFHFGCMLESADFARRELRFTGDDAQLRRTAFDSVIGADGANSTLRVALQRVIDLGERVESMAHGYKELRIPSAPNGAFRVEPHALHLWPRGGFMLIALPNLDGSFTATLFLPRHGAPGFDSLDSPAAVRALFDAEFPTAAPLLPDLVSEFERNPVGPLATLYLQRWHLDGRALLIGDAAHAIVPFHGQGMNCAFEDCVELDRLLAAHADTATAFAEFSARRKPDTDAIASMAIENYVEMRDAVVDERFALLKQLERSLAGLHPERFVPRYSMIMFRRIGYAEAQRRGQIQQRILDDLLGNASDLDAIDYSAAAQRIESELDPLP
ncbi:MAG: FAD-dependent monooxygenase [Xanthomonadales bacterium]|nr:FAD-dependent monooxygenase [Xanthomonadales bacterium]